MINKKVNTHKECRVCGAIKPISEFYKGHAKCKSCVNQRWREHRANNRDEINRRDRERYANDPEYRERIHQRRRERHANDPEYREDHLRRCREWYANNRERRANDPEYRERVRQQGREREQKLRANNPNYKLSTTLRTRIHGAIKNQCTTKATSSLELLGADDISVVREHLESLFRPGMTWENHGVDGRHIDHIRPCTSFDLTDPEQQRACFHYTNLQPLWSHENLAKGDSY